MMFMFKLKGSLSVINMYELKLSFFKKNVKKYLAFIRNFVNAKKLDERPTLCTFQNRE